MTSSLGWPAIGSIFSSGIPVHHKTDPLRPAISLLQLEHHWIRHPHPPSQRLWEWLSFPANPDQDNLDQRNRVSPKAAALVRNVVDE